MSTALFSLCTPSFVSSFPTLSFFDITHIWCVSYPCALALIRETSPVSLCHVWWRDVVSPRSLRWCRLFEVFIKVGADDGETRGQQTVRNCSDDRLCFYRQSNVHAVFVNYRNDNNIHELVRSKLISRLTLTNKHQQVLGDHLNTDYSKFPVQSWWFIE